MSLLPEPREIRRHTWRTPRPTIAQASAVDPALTSSRSPDLHPGGHARLTPLHDVDAAHLTALHAAKEEQRLANLRSARAQLTGARGRRARHIRKNLTQQIRTLQRHLLEQAQPSSRGSWRPPERHK